MFYRDKKFTRIGNSVALIIDRAMLAECNIRTDEMVRIRSDGFQMVIEQVPEGEFDPAAASDLAWDIKKNAFRKTWDVVGPSVERADLIALGSATTASNRFWMFRHAVERAKTAVPELELVMDRLEYLRAYVEELGWEEAMKKAIEIVPDRFGISLPVTRREVPAVAPAVAPLRPTIYDRFFGPDDGKPDPDLLTDEQIQADEPTEAEQKAEAEWQAHLARCEAARLAARASADAMDGRPECSDDRS
ncbi:MAG: hypothetical protein QM831_41910 [Kofleriaceae bacterium]